MEEPLVCLRNCAGVFGEYARLPESFCLRSQKKDGAGASVEP
jgi:hypothetical protein